MALIESFVVSIGIGKGIGIDLAVVTFSPQISDFQILF